MKKIPVGKSGFALVDDEDYPLPSEYKWQRSSYGYAMAHIGRINGHQKSLIMARVIMNAPKGLLVDHIDGNILNNQKSNLRLATKAQNVQHRVKLNSNNKTGARGVHKRPYGAYCAQITFNFKCVSLGHYKTIKEAASAYDAAAKILHKNFATTNEMLKEMGKA